MALYKKHQKTTPQQLSRNNYTKNENINLQ